MAEVAKIKTLSRPFAKPVLACAADDYRRGWQWRSDSGKIARTRQILQLSVESYRVNSNAPAYLQSGFQLA
jgi:hypothetical protein